MGEDMPTDSRVELLYDAECPLCDAYCKAIRLHETAGALVLVDARQASGVKDELTRRGLDIQIECTGARTLPLVARCQEFIAQSHGPNKDQ